MLAQLQARPDHATQPEHPTDEPPSPDDQRSVQAPDDHQRDAAETLALEEDLDIDR